jgi:hypothetical protein
MLFLLETAGTDCWHLNPCLFIVASGLTAYKPNPGWACPKAKVRPAAQA